MQEMQHVQGSWTGEHVATFREKLRSDLRNVSMLSSQMIYLLTFVEILYHTTFFHHRFQTTIKYLTSPPFSRGAGRVDSKMLIEVHAILVVVALALSHVLDGSIHFLDLASIAASQLSTTTRRKRY
jgi:hypothetical protein